MKTKHGQALKARLITPRYQTPNKLTWNRFYRVPPHFEIRSPMIRPMPGKPKIQNLPAVRKPNISIFPNPLPHDQHRAPFVLGRLAFMNSYLGSKWSAPTLFFNFTNRYL